MDFENNPYDRVRGYQQVCRCRWHKQNYWRCTWHCEHIRSKVFFCRSRWHTFRFYAYNTGILILWYTVCSCSMYILFMPICGVKTYHTCSVYIFIFIYVMETLCYLWIIHINFPYLQSVYLFIFICGILSFLFILYLNSYI